MDTKRIKELKKTMHTELLVNTLPFWVQHAIDTNDGGYNTYLDRSGKPLSSFKPMWVAGRFAWVLARVYNDIEKEQKWLDYARHGIEFIDRYGFDSDGRMFYIVDKTGQPIQKRRYLFTETFTVIAYAEYARASGNIDYLQKAKDLMALILHYYRNTELLAPKYIKENFSARSHSMAMIQINTLQVVRDAAEQLQVEQTIPGYGDITRLIHSAINEVTTYFVKPDLKALLETVGMQGEYLSHLPEGRLVNPGHPIETAWFMLVEGRRTENQAIINSALDILNWSLALGWDPEYGGILYFVDIEGKQPVQLEWDMKLWWPHNEALIATLLAYSMTGESQYISWFEKIYDWSLTHFPDREQGEWIGYLHRDGSTALDLKGNYFKGPFHLPRQQIYCYNILSEMDTAKTSGK